MERGLKLMRNLAGDFHYALRQFRRTPGYALFAVLVLALGIGTVTAMFTIAYAVLLKPLPFKADRGLFQPVGEGPDGDFASSLPYDEILQWQQATQGTARIAFTGGGLNIADGPAGAVLINEINVSRTLFDVLGAQPILGRTFLPGEVESGRSDLVILSYSLWQQEFSGDPTVIGKTLHFGRTTRTVIGVMPPNFTYPVWIDRPQSWVPIERSDLTASTDSYSFFAPLIRVNQRVPVKDVEAQLSRVHAQFSRSREDSLRLAGLRALLVDDVRPALLALEIAVALVWLIACSNVAGLMLARVTARRREIAVRAALGAARHRIVMQFLIESFALSCAGALAGLALAAAMLRAFRPMLSSALPLSSGIHLNWVIWAWLAMLALLTAVIFGAAPALLAVRTEINAALKSGARTQSGAAGENRLRAVLLTGQVALSITLLIAASLMMQTMYRLRHVPLGFRTDHLVLSSLTIPSDLYADRNVGAAVWQPLLDEIRRVPGVRSAALSTVLPIQHPVELLTKVYATQWMPADAGATVRAATPGLNEALGIRMVRGRFFSEEDTASSLPVIVVNQAFVNRFLGGNQAIGKVIRFGRVPRAATIVGVIEDVHQDSVAGASQPEFYLCLSQVLPDQQIYRALLGRFMQVAVRTQLSPEQMIPELRRAIQQANPHLAIGGCTTMSEAVEDSIQPQKLAARVIAVFGSLVLLITLVGFYGLLNFLVAQRTQEIGIRMALGADRGHVIAMVVRHTLTLLIAGTAIGVCLAIACGHLLQAFLFGVSASDPLTITAACLLLLLCGLLAAVVPARRAASVNPVDALRSE